MVVIVIIVNTFIYLKNSIFCVNLEKSFSQLCISLHGHSICYFRGRVNEMVEL